MGSLTKTRQENRGFRGSPYALFESLLNKADIEINGSRSWDFQLHDKRFIPKLITQGNLALGEAYMAGQWDARRLDEFFFRILRHGIDQQIRPRQVMLDSLRARLFNLQSLSRSFQVGEQHYDIGNEVYEAMLDSRLTYTCGYWKTAANLEQAQTDKLDLVCKKMGLRPGMKVLDIGCGWGSFMSYAAQHYGVECVGVTVSKEQTEWAQQRYASLPITFRLQDYREIDGQFDRIISLGMFEHVGRKNHAAFMQVARRCLKENGLMLLHTIGKNRRHSVVDPWIDRYVFPNGDLPSIGQIGDAADALFVTEDLHNFGADYDKTLMAWHRNFELAWPDRLADKFDSRFYRMWRYYLLSCAGAFRARDIQLWQWVFSPRGELGGYARHN
ncbi:cyclopropane fatty acyl phospholipid synthase [Spongiibacter taiwanensis]|uniref:cyclopropane fatty acyl phospholipid synthase n=1 Tax=Spongiibacter taiwanensis TaxID=1748242 RepID=UPI002034BAB5|nr:cyclopropane fatty acyl phospholipid synthase [Spongiibacter taiwanensis]USA41831.1 cyclopropane fatty acyl phospholipid synthase [Spongiibacter taiwanensis]